MPEIKIILIEVFHLVLRYSGFDSSDLILKVSDVHLSVSVPIIQSNQGRFEPL